MVDSFVSVRRADSGDGDFMADMLVAAVNWSPRWKPKSRERVLSKPETSRYLAGWPLPADLGSIAEAHGRPVGAVWLRYFPASRPGYGFVADDVPELTIGVVAKQRGQGIGRLLLRTITEQARTAGIERISLSVEEPNFARRLYLSDGFRVVGSSYQGSVTMVKELGAHPAVS